MHEVDRIIGQGFNSYVFGIKGHNRIIVKTRRDNSKSMLKAEWVKGNILKKLGIPVPKYIGVGKIFFPKNFDTIVEKHYGDRLRIVQEELKKYKRVVKWGLFMEFIDNGMRQANYQEVERSFAKEIKKVKELGIIPDETSLRSFSCNLLWSSKKRKIYFIDFDTWKIPKKYFSERILKRDGILTSVKNWFKS